MPPKKKGGKKNIDNFGSDDDKVIDITKAVSPSESEDEDDIPVPKKPAKKSTFKYLVPGSDDDEDSIPTKSSPPLSDESDDDIPVEKAAPKPKQAPPAKKKDKKKKGKGQKDDVGGEEDLDAVFAELGVTPTAAPAPAAGKKKGKKGAAVAAAAVPAEASPPPAEQPPAPVAAPEVKEESKTPEPTPPPAEEDEDDAAAAEAKRNKAKEKKKKKKEKEKEKTAKEDDEGDKKKKKKKANVGMLLELLKAKEEAEERERELAEQAKREAEEFRRQEEERIRLEEERKEEAKRKKAELIAQQKRDGTYKTAAQQKRDQEALKRLQANQNIILPGQRQGRAPLPGQRVKKNQKAGSTPVETPKVRTPEPEIVEKEPPKIEEPVEAEKPAEEEILDDWELAHAEEDQKPASKQEKEKPGQKVIQSQKTGSKPPVAQDSKESSDEEESESESESDSSSEEEDEGEAPSTDVVETVQARFTKRKVANDAKRSADNLRAPVICVLGHVDTGKTKMLDTIRRTNVQLNEAGGITQQIGATRVPVEAIKERCRRVRDFHPDDLRIPGFLIIDTPGHESFSNLRSRGSSLCDIAILVVDIMHGLEPQTLESLKLLRKRNTPFVVALNKIDRLYGYESNPQKDVYAHLKAQGANIDLEFQERVNHVILEFSEQGLNIALSNANPDPNEYISMVPTSALQGDGIGNLLAYIAEFSQTRLENRIMFSNELDCTVMEVRVLAGLGTTIDVILLNGTLKVNDVIVLTGTDGAIITQVRDLLMPAALKEIRVKTDFEHYKQIQGAQGVKILAKGLEKAVAGLPLYVVERSDELEVLRQLAQEQLHKALTSIKKKAEGVYVQASTLGSLEALLEFLKAQKIPYSGVNIGPVHKKDVQKAATMLEHKSEYACILAFDVPVDRDVQAFADAQGVRVFQANIIYHLEDAFLKYREELRLQRRRENEHIAIFPCKLKVMPQHVFKTRDPIVVGVMVVAGQVKKGTPICVPSKENIVLGTISSIEHNHESVEHAKAGDEVCIKIENTTGEAPKMYGRHFTADDVLVSRINRESIDACKNFFRDDLSKADWQLVVELKKSLGIF